jgi:cobalt/nickel transport system permease protein
VHIPEGFLDIKTLVVTDGIAGVLLVLSAKKVERDISSESVAKMGIATSFVFAVNMFAFPVAGGTSAHLTGVVLISAILGGWHGFICSSVALFLQAVLFQHGGILSLGANIINISGWGALLGSIARRFRKFKPLAGGILSFLAVILGSITCAGELYLSKRGSFLRGATAMALGNLFPAVIDGVITFFVLKFLKKD